MGRKSLALERREQILDAFERCIQKYGFEKSSLEKIAQEAGVKRSIIRHYIGNRDDLIKAMIDRMILIYRQKVTTLIKNLPEANIIPELLNKLFDDKPMGEFHQHNEIVMALWKTHQQDPYINKLLFTLYQEFKDLIAQVLSYAYPQLSEKERLALAYSLLSLANGHEDMQLLGFDPAYRHDAHQSARKLLSHLEQSPSYRNGVTSKPVKNIDNI